MSPVLFNLLMSAFFFIDVFAYYRMLNNKLSFRFSSYTIIPAYTLIYVLWLLCSYSNELFPGLPLKMPFMFLFFVCLFILYKDAIYKKLLWIVITFFIQLVCELITIPLILVLTETKFADFAENSAIQIIGTFLSRTLLLIIVELLLRRNKKIFNEFLRNFFVIILIDVIYAFIIINLFYFDNIYLTVDVAITLSVLAIFIITLLALYLLRKITRKSDEIMTTNLKLQQIEMEHKQNQDMAIVVEDLRALRHDMNNHMSVLQGLLTMKEYEDASAYLSTITKELAVANSFVLIDNKVLSVLINNKISKARQLGIAFDTEFLTYTTPFSDRDLCAVVGNILENAIEASSTHSNPYIYFSIRQKHNCFFIQCDNTYSVPPVFEKGNLVTTKSDKSYHGIGTKTIRSIVDNYRGTTEFTVDELFHVNISIPL